MKRAYTLGPKQFKSSAQNERNMALDNDENIFSHLITEYKTWVHCCNPDIKQ